MTTIIRSLQAVLFAVLIVIACWICVFLETLNTVTANLPLVIDSSIAREATLTRSVLTMHVGIATEAAVKQIVGLRRDVRLMEEDPPPPKENQ